MQRTDLANDPELQTNPDRAARMDRLDNIISEWTSTVTTTDLIDMLYIENIPAAPVVSLAKLLIDPQVQEREMLRKVEQPGRGEMLTFGNPIRLSDSDPVPLLPAPELGEHSAIVLEEHLGLNQDNVADLITKGVI
jgi:crotonobetainyl-CoA:carnitine CoA-transferase CaiB-like acyl-CoA transferase